MEFKEALLKAADGNAAVQEIVTDPKKIEVLEGFVSCRVSGEGYAAIDWANLVAAIREFMPLILQIIALFKQPVTTVALLLAMLFCDAASATEPFVVTEQTPIQAVACNGTSCAPARYNSVACGGNACGGRRGWRPWRPFRFRRY